jgi:hypothetical protein
LRCPSSDGWQPFWLHRSRPFVEILFRNSILFYLLLAATITLGLFYRKRQAGC